MLALGLSGLQFQPGLPIPGAESTPEAAAPVAETGAQIPSSGLPLLLQGALALGFTVLLGLFLVNLVRKSSKKRMLQLAGGGAAVLILLLLLPRTLPAPDSGGPGEVQAVATRQPQTFEIAAIGDPPAELVWFVLGGLILGLIGLGIWLLIQARRRARLEDPLAQQAGEALRAIQAGEDLRDVIVRCYLQMAQAVRDERGIEREESVTPREFERTLTAKGVPAEPIRGLTRLFEKARYGGKSPDPADEAEAVACLTAIRAALRRAK